MSRCYYILAVMIFVGLPVIDDNKEVNFRRLSKRKLKYSDKKSGRKRANDVDVTVIHAPDSTLEQNKKPNSYKKIRFNT